ncbi:MAG: helix-turn-helix domain-containing protein [Clostridiales bacterium]|nr:helix-turn-helix domain-containing protein [Clostridiales bacterium]
MTTQQLCRHIICLIHAPIHVYRPDGELVTIYEGYGEQQDLFRSDPAFCRHLLEQARKDMPLLFLEGDSVLYGIVQGEGAVFLVGPCCLSENVTQAGQFLQRWHRLEQEPPYRVSLVSLELFAHGVLMLAETVSDVSVDINTLVRMSFCDSQDVERMNKYLHRVLYDNQEQAALHNPYRQELREQGSIRSGDMELLMESFQEVYVGRVGKMSADPLRQAKYHAAIVTALASRSAMAAGVQPELAYSMTDAYIQQIDEVQNGAEALAYMRQAEIDYCKLVHGLSETETEKEPPLVSACKELIMQQLHSKIEVQDLAKQLGVSTKHLSGTFSRTTGLKLKDYIMREKIHAAKSQLIYTDDSYKSIAYTYAFSSQSHFGAEFKKWTGMTPGQYRKQYGREPQ